jgi:membrane protein DedA with SNARE-associated domain/rhodanese-related sulfurtransferase
MQSGYCFAVRSRRLILLVPAPYRFKNLKTDPTVMDSWISNLAAHGFVILFTAVFLEAIGFPVPAALALLIAGGASARGVLPAPYAVTGAIAAMLAGDTLMFVIGRYTGWWLLGLLCRISLNPESCILRSADSFFRRGRKLLLIAKFIPGINTMAPPMAGCMNMRFSQFIRLDLVGATFYIASYFSVGFVFSGALEAITKGYQAFGRVFGWIGMVLIVGYVAWQCWRWIRERRLRTVPFAIAADAARAMRAGAYVYDVRSHGYLDRNAVRISGSRRLDPHTLHRLSEEIPAGQMSFVYCTCVREATSVRVARELEKSGIQVAVIRGGLRAWKKQGLPIEPVPHDEMATLPAFR